MTWIIWDSNVQSVNHHVTVAEQSRSAQINEVARRFKAAIIETDHNRSRMTELFNQIPQPVMNAIAAEMHRQSERMRAILDNSFPESAPQADKVRFMDSIRELEACFAKNFRKPF